MECMKDMFVKDQLLDGRFRSVAPLNHGSFGMVFLAEDTLSQQQVAIKCLVKPGPNAPANEGAEELACHMMLKHHSHLVNLLHYFETDAHSYLVLEYCAQGDLYEAIRLDRGPLETEHVRDFMLQLISAVDYMHARGLYHRDIKPENIFLTHQGSMKLGDFGLATTSPWCADACVGSDRYMAPEQYDPAGVAYAPAKADIWSIGICLLNILFSRNPFVTPTESDVLFADYRRDRQSLFDIFPNMSQDTFEVLNIALALDPDRRDLTALRQAILRVVSFTTDDESLDEFCTEERDVVRASANREPLRTPSIQSPQINAGDSFPWARALHTSPAKQNRQLSAIPDTEIYDEDLFPASEIGHCLGESWYQSISGNTPSLGSVLGSAFATSFKSLAITKAGKHNPPRPGPIPISGSLPMHASRPLPSMSTIFGKRESMAKSWSDLYDEDTLEQQHNPDSDQHQQPARVPSPTVADNMTVRPGILTESKSHSSVNVRRSPERKAASPIKSHHSPNENDPYHFRDLSPKVGHSKQSFMDKWAALGDKRRNYQPNKAVQAPSATKRRSMTTGWRKDNNHGSSGFDYSAWQRRESKGDEHPAWTERDWRRDQHPLPARKRSIDKFVDDDEYEWVVGGWRDFHD